MRDMASRTLGEGRRRTHTYTWHAQQKTKWVDVHHDACGARGDITLPSGGGRAHPGDGGVRPEMGPDLGVRGGAPGKIFGPQSPFPSTNCMWWDDVAITAKHKVKEE